MSGTYIYWLTRKDDTKSISKMQLCKQFTISIWIIFRPICFASKFGIKTSFASNYIHLVTKTWVLSRRNINNQTIKHHSGIIDEPWNY